MEETPIDKLRNKLKELNLERDKIILEKGLSARENNDLRENFAYDYWEQKERMITIRIQNLIQEIEDLVKNKKKA